MANNPFDELGLDPTLSSRDLTKRLKRMAERATPEDRARIQSLWEKITVSDAQRVKYALLAHPRPAHADASGLEKLKAAIPPPVSALEHELPKLTHHDTLAWRRDVAVLDRLRPDFPWS